MKSIHLRPAEPDRDFGRLAGLFSTMVDEPTTEPGLREEFEQRRELIFQRLAVDELGEMLGFYWAEISRVEAEHIYFYLAVKPEHRRQGVGARLYAHLVAEAGRRQARRLRVSVRDDCPECREFAERRGFSERRHMLAMALDLQALDDGPYDAVLQQLEAEGFCFTSMEELGNSEQAQRRLYALNDSASASTPGTDGEHSWASFEDFQQSVCQAKWFKPAGQIVAIETATGNWAAMSAITRFEGRDYAYNLFTGVDFPYRGRKLGQAVKILALRYARQLLEVAEVRTHHNTLNLPMLAIDRKLGYRKLSGTFLMEKALDSI